MSEECPCTSAYRVTHVLNNNAVAAVPVEAETPTILVGKGIGFGCKPGNFIEAEAVEQQYVALESHRMQYLNLLGTISPELLGAISSGVALAEEQLGSLHPSVYLMLTDHLAFAVQRLDEGEAIANPLLPEIRARFPEEFIAAEVLLRHVNAQLDLALPIDEAAFITLHLRAASTGASVKQPLSQANALAGLAETVIRQLGGSFLTVDESARHELTSYLARLADRVGRGELRTNAAHLSIRRDLPAEYAQAEAIIDDFCADRTLPVSARRGEAAYTAVFLHGWLQDAARQHP